MRIDLPNPHAFDRLLKMRTGTELPREVSGISLDSREVHPGDLFIALRGERADGHKFINAAQRAGAAAALVAEAQPEVHIAQIVVTDPATTLAEISASWRIDHPIPLVGITGSNGKTTTKDLLLHIFSCEGTAHGTRCNYNTRLGLPLTLLEMSPSHTISFVEMGADHAGDIAYLCSLAIPTHGLITCVAPAHLAGFETMDTLIRTKGELFTSLPSEGYAFVNLDDPWVSTLSTPARRVTYSVSQSADFRGSVRRSGEGNLWLTVNGREADLHSQNPTFAKTALAAAAVSATLGTDWDAYQESLATFQPPKGRCQILQARGIEIIDDTYNANLNSTLAALEFLASLPVSGRRIAVLGDMLELGAASEEHHRAVGVKVAEMNIDLLLCHGPESRATAEEAGRTVTALHFGEKGELSRQLRACAKPGDAVLIKGSRGMAMETILRDLERN